MILPSWAEPQLTLFWAGMKQISDLNPKDCGVTDLEMIADLVLIQKPWVQGFGHLPREFSLGYLLVHVELRKVTPSGLWSRAWKKTSSFTARPAQIPKLYVTYQEEGDVNIEG